MGLKTPLFQQHLAAGAKVVEFSGWDMPLHYGSQVEEHHRVRRECGMFDVSHMGVVDLRGPGVGPYLRQVLANDVAKLGGSGGALYSCLLNEQGGVMDDLIVYYLEPHWYRMVVNAGTQDKDLAWLGDRARGHDVRVLPRADLAMLAIQGPQARARVDALLTGQLRESARELKRFVAAWDDELFLARTGYTGEDGYEAILSGADLPEFWNRLMAQGVSPVGLGARDTLRLEAGLNLYGADMDEDTSPLESGLAWTVAWEPADRKFIGRGALERQRQGGVSQVLVGLVLEGRGVLRAHQEVRAASGGVGRVTSGTFSPTLGRSIALARVPAGTEGMVQVQVRGRSLAARVVKPPFVREGAVRV